MSTAAIEEHDSVETLLSFTTSFADSESEITIKIVAKWEYRKDPIRDEYVSFILESIEMMLERERQEQGIR